MEIEFSRHALDQLQIRSRITKDMVLKAIKNSDNVARSYRGREIYNKKHGKELLEVITIKEDNRIIIITQYFLEK